MPFVTEPFQAYLAAPLPANDVNLPLSQAAEADLLKLLQAPGSYTFLSIRDDVNFETVKAYILNTCYIVLDRGQAGTTPVKFSYGACVSSLTPTAVAVIQAMLNDTSTGCFSTFNPDAMGGTLSISFVDLPTATVAKQWRGMIVLGGTLRPTVTVSGAPAWVTVTHTDNMVEFTGTPSASASSIFSLHATNVLEGVEINQQFSIVVR